MRRAAIFPFLGPATILYFVADVSSSSKHGLDAAGFAIAALATLLSCSLLGLRDPSQERGGQRVAWLGFACGASLLGLISPAASERLSLFGGETLRMSVQVAQALALAALGVLVSDLATSVPDAVLPVRLRGGVRAATYAAGVVCALLSIAALGPVLSLHGAPWIVPARLARAAISCAGVAVLLALVLRLARRSLGSTPEVLASNGWAVLALVPATLLAGLLIVAHFAGWALSPSLVRTAGAVSALALYVGHVWLIDPRRRLSAGPVLREIVAAAIAVAGVSLVALVLREHVPRSPLAFTLWIAAALCVGLGAFQGLGPIVQSVLAPARGRLIEALRAFPESTSGVHTLGDLSRVVLGCMRRASGSPDSAPMLYGFDPAFEARIDAAGEAHLSERPLHAAILERLRSEPGVIILRAPLEAQIVRNPPLRPLIEALVEHDALCVLPLMTEGELEGALIVPRGMRRVPLTLEELSALRDHARFLSALLSVFSAHRRAEARTHELIVSQERAEARAENMDDELSRLRADVELLHAGRGTRAEAPALVAYSPAMRELVERMRGLSSLEVPVCLIAEPGTALEPLARVLHVEAGRSHEPFLALSCAALRADESAAVLFGGKHGETRHAGALRIAGAGTLLLTDVVALSSEAQRLLALALASRSARPVDGGEPYAVQARVVLSTRVDLEALAARGRFDTDLAARLSPVSLRVPALRECPEDLESHALLAIDRACRRQGREPIGFDPETLALLAKHPWHENVTELERVIDLAVQHARGERLLPSDLPLDAKTVAALADSPLTGTLEEVERRALEHALARAGGNKSEAARLLGLPRTTLLDKLRRHNLETATRDSLPPN